MSPDGAVDVMQPPARVSRFKAGLIFCLLTIMTGWGAVQSGANLTYLVFGTMLGILVISGLAAARNLMGVRVRRELPKYIHAGRPVSVRLVAENRAGSLSGFSIKVSDGLPEDARVLESNCYSLRVPPQGKADLEYTVVFEKRGLHRFKSITVHSCFPFGFFGNWKSIRAPEEALLYPRLGKLREKLNFELGGGVEYAEGLWVTRRAGTEDFYGLREYRAGDNPKRIHWKRSAKMRKPLVMEFVKPPEREVDIYLDSYVSPGWGERLEACVSLAATLLARLQREGYCVSVKLPGQRMLRFGGDWREYHTIMRELALLQASQNGLVPGDIEPEAGRLAILVLPEYARAGSPLAGAVKAKYQSWLVLAAGTDDFDSFFSLEDGNADR